MTPLADRVYEFDDFLLDPKQRVLRLRHEPVPLTPKAFEMLLVLVQSQGLLMTKNELIKAVWADSFVEDSNLTQIVFVLRKALGETPDRRYILTVQGQGYRFAADVRVVPRNGIPTEHVRLPGLEASATIESGPNPASETEPLEHSLDRKLWLIIAGALTAFLIAVAAGYLRWSSAGALPQPPPGRVMLAVLPFQNLTGDAAQEYFSDGMTEEMITQMGNLDPQHLGVIARTTVMHYKTAQTPLDQVGRDLGVEYVIEGSVRRDANNVRITAQLIQTKDQTHVWARQYDRELKGLLTLQGEIAQEIADELQLTLGDHSLVAAHSVPVPQNYEAYDFYLKGQYFFNTRTAPSLKEAIADFEQATSKDPNYARAYAGLANAYALLGAYSDLPQTEFVPKARAAALRALQIDDSLSEAHTALALIAQNYDWDWQTAEKEFRRAIELNSNYPTAHHWYAEHLMWRSRFDEALQESERARQLDPLSLIIAADNGAILYFSRQYDRAIQKLGSVLEMDPGFSRAHLIMGAHVERGMFAEALADNERFRRVTPVSSYLSWRAYIYGRGGQMVEARQALHELLLWNKTHAVDPMILAWAYVGMGDKNQALVWVEKAYAEHSTELVALKVNPAYDPLRTEPRFQDLVRRVGLTQ